MKITTIKKTGINKQLLLLAAAAALYTAALLLFWYKGAFIPSSVQFNDAQFAYAGGEVTIANRHVKLCMNENPVWVSPWNVNVQQGICADIDRDGAEELLLLCQKRGSYGKHRPFWVERNDCEMGQHIFIYRWDERENRLRAIWMSSTLPIEIVCFEADEKGFIHIFENDDKESVWYWEHFGLKSL